MSVPDGLTVPTDNEILLDIAHAIQHRPDGSKLRMGDDLGVRLLAERVLEHLQRGGYAILKKVTARDG
jgi:hypothetical protein